MENKTSAKKWLLAGLVFFAVFLVTAVSLWFVFFPGKYKPFQRLATDIAGVLVDRDKSTILTEKTVEKQNCEEAKITLKATGKSKLEPRKPIDVVFVIDRSGSMDDPGVTAETKIKSLKTAAVNFINQMNFSSENGSPDRISIVSYADTARIDYSLGSDKNAAISAVNNLVAKGWTCAGCGLELANNQLKNELTNMRLQTVVFLSDGKANCGRDDRYCNNTLAGTTYAIEEAAKIKDNLLLPIYSIGYGTDADENTLKKISSGDGYYFSGDTDDIVEIYNKIIKNITDISGYNAQVVEVLPDGADYISGTFSPREPDIISSDGKTLTWKIGDLLVGDIREFSFKVKIDHLKFNLASPISTNKYPDTRVQFNNYDNTAYYTPFPLVTAQIDECPRPAIELKKSADKAEIIAGEKVKYTFEVNNTGNNLLSNISIMDDKLGAIVCPKSQLASKEKMVCVREAVLEDHTTNVALVKGTDAAGQEVTDEATANVLVGVRDENINIIKNVDRSLVAAGETVNYTYKISNEGNVTIRNLVVEDDKLGAITCPKTELVPGDSMDCTGKQAVIEKDTVNLVSVTGVSAITGETLVNSDTAEVKISPAEISIEKTASADSVKKGEEVTYNFEVTNTGQTEITEIAVVDDKLGTIDCPKTSLAVGEEMVCAKSKVINEDTTNVATVTGKNPGGKTVTDQSSAVTVWIRDEVLSVDKKVDRDKVASGEEVEYSYQVTNGGNVKIVDLSVEDDKLGDIDCPKSELEPGETMNCSSKKAVIDDDTVNTVTVIGKSAISGETLKGTDKVEVSVSPEGISIRKSVSASKVKKGQEVTYNFEVTNSGQTALSDIEVKDDKLGTIDCPKTSLAVGEKMTCAEKKVINQTTTNVAVVTGKNPGGKTVSDKSSSVTVSTEKEESADGEIGNLVWYDINCDGIQDDNEPGLEDIRVKAKWSGPNDKRGDRDDVEFRTDTNHNGHYKFEDLKDGEYRITVKEEDVVGYVQSYDPDGELDNKTDIEIEDGDGTTKADFGYCKKKTAPATGISWIMVALAGALSIGLMTVFFMIKKKRI